MQGAATATAPDDMEDEAVAKVVSELKFKDANEEEMAYVSYRPLDASRRQIMAAAFPEAASGRLLQVMAKKDSDSREFTVAFKGDTLENPTILMGSCQITYEDLTPSECVEFCFAEEPEVWHMAQLGQEALEHYRGMKFEAWKNLLVSPSCEAAFRRMLQIGMIAELYDPQVFPTPEAQKPKFQVTDEKTGKLIELPHPVHGLRVWGAAKQDYVPIETRLTGAPSNEEAAQWWQGFVEELNTKHGAEYIAGLLEGK